MITGQNFIGIGVGALVFNQDAFVFLAKRGDAARNERGCWEFPGGGLVYGERLHDAVRREFVEEYGLQIDVVELLGAFDHILREEGQHWVSITFIARYKSGIAKILEPAKCSAIGWFRLSALPSPRTRITEDNLKTYYTKYGERVSW
jgi:8-oxo-dGTP diphosphatase